MRDSTKMVWMDFDLEDLSSSDESSDGESWSDSDCDSSDDEDDSSTMIGDGDENLKIHDITQNSNKNSMGIALLKNQMTSAPTKKANNNNNNNGNPMIFAGVNQFKQQPAGGGDFMDTDLQSVVSGAPTIMSVNAIAMLKQKYYPTQSNAVNMGAFHKSASTPNFIRQTNMVDICQHGSAQDNGMVTESEEKEEDVKPYDHLISLLKEHGIVVEPKSSKSLLNDDFFHKLTDAHVGAYEMDIVGAVRSNNVNAIKSFYGNGRNLLCCNKFGESIMHTACRRGSSEMMEFLLLEAELPVRLCDDSGRTPLHDACWASRPNFECVKLILSECPDLLLIQDNHGFTPLSFVPRTNWRAWNAFLDDNQDIIKPQHFI